VRESLFSEEPLSIGGVQLKKSISVRREIAENGKDD